MPNVTTEYIVTGTNLSNCQDTAKVTIRVNPNPIVNISPTQSGICAGDSTTISVSGALNYLWSPISGLSSSTDSIVKASPGNTRTYTVVGTDHNGCNDTVSTLVNVYPLPVLSITANKDSICRGSSTILTATGANSYIWGPGSSLSNTTGSTTNASPNQHTNYYVIGTSSDNCVDTTYKEIKVLNLPSVSIYPPHPELCTGDSINLIASGANNYSWSPA
jgi:hypothetical protein